MTRRDYFSCALFLIGNSSLKSQEKSPAQKKATSSDSSIQEEAPTVSEAWQNLDSLAEAGNMQHRQYAGAAFALLATRQSKALTKVGKLLSSDREVTVRSFTAAALGQEKCRSAMPMLRQALDDESGVVALSAAKALWDMGDRSGVTIFEQVLLGERKGSTGLISGYITDAKHTLRDPKSLALMGAKEATGAFFGPAGTLISLAQESLKDKGATGRALAAGELARERSKEVRQVLQSALQDSNGIVRAAACRSLAINGGTDSLPYIEPLLTDKNEAARAMAAAAFIMLRAGGGNKKVSKGPVVNTPDASRPSQK